jgi:opacity protein-like surface antigen
MATITDPSANQTFLARFPGFTTEMTTFHIGGIIKQKSILNPFIGLSFATGIGKVSNTKFSPDPAEYGVGGPKTAILAFGGIIKTGVNYDLTKVISVGVEYRYQYLKIQDTNQQFRSFNKGFTGTVKSNAILINLGYKFDI